MFKDTVWERNSQLKSRCVQLLLPSTHRWQRWGPGVLWPLEETVKGNPPISQQWSARLSSVRGGWKDGSMPLRSQLQIVWPEGLESQGSKTGCDKDVREVGVWADGSERTRIAALHRKTHGRARTAGKAGTSQVDRDHQSLPSLHHVNLDVIYPHKMWLPWPRRKACMKSTAWICCYRDSLWSVLLPRTWPICTGSFHNTCLYCTQWPWLAPLQAVSQCSVSSEMSPVPTVNSFPHNPTQQISSKLWRQVSVRFHQHTAMYGKVVSRELGLCSVQGLAFRPGNWYSCGINKFSWWSEWSLSWNTYPIMMRKIDIGSDSERMGVSLKDVVCICR